MASRGMNVQLELEATAC
ncbi:unnamed protein product [Victoria cruziana]